MTSLDEVYRKFGETSEAAQLLETELGTLLLQFQAVDEGLLRNGNPERAAQLLTDIDKSTLGRLLRRLNSESGVDLDEDLLLRARDVRNDLAHSFYRRHNLRRNTNDGRTIMLSDLEDMHTILMSAYKAVMLVSGIDLDQLARQDRKPPTEHLPI